MAAGMLQVKVEPNAESEGKNPIFFDLAHNDDDIDSDPVDGKFQIEGEYEDDDDIIDIFLDSISAPRSHCKDCKIDSLKPVTVATQSLTHNGASTGNLSEVTRFYVQESAVMADPEATILDPGAGNLIADAFCSKQKKKPGDLNDSAAKDALCDLGATQDRDKAGTEIKDDAPLHGCANFGCEEDDEEGDDDSICSGEYRHIMNGYDDDDEEEGFANRMCSEEYRHIMNGYGAGDSDNHASEDLDDDPEAELQDMINKVGAGGCDTVDLPELLSLMSKRMRDLEVEELTAALENSDHDGNEFISAAKLHHAMLNLDEELPNAEGKLFVVSEEEEEEEGRIRREKEKKEKKRQKKQQQRRRKKEEKEKEKEKDTSMACGEHRRAG